jgi:ABC-type lipoprotein release transport system permease subunit
MPSHKAKPGSLTLVGLAWRSLQAHPGRTLLTLLGIALGVAAVLATSITNRNASATLDAMFKRTIGGAELQVVPPGNKTIMRESVLEMVRSMPEVRLAVPVIRTDTVMPGTLGEGQLVYGASGQVKMGKSVEVDGIDPALEPEMRVYTLASGRFPVLGEYEALVPQSFADQNNLELGGDLELYGPDGTESLKITGLLANEGAAMTNSGNVVFAPIDVVQKVFALGQGYSDISIQAQAGVGDDPRALAELKTSLASRLGQVARVAYPAARADQVPRMANSYQFTLSFFSIVALFMGAFLIYNTFATTVLERTQEIGLLRAIGMQRRQIMGQVLMEAGLLSLLGCLVGLADRRQHKPNQLSGGEQQRVAIARALVTQPAILLADEPTGNLDSKTGTAIMELLRRSRDELQQTIIMVTHDPRAATYADRVVFLRDGQIQHDILFTPQQDMEFRLSVVIHTMEEPQS